MLNFRRFSVLVKRDIHHSSVRAGNQLKEKLHYFKTHNVVLRKTAKQLVKLQEQKNRDIKKLHKTPYSKQHALHILNKKYLNSSPDADPIKIDIGPASNEDVQYMTMTKDKRMMYTILGISGEQLRDAKLVNDVVTRFLRRSQVEKAIWVVRLAKQRGASGLNSIIKYYIKDMNQPLSAIKLYNWSKKWGIPTNEYTYTILFSELSQVPQPLSKKIIDSISNIVERKIEKNELNQIEYNAALSTLCNHDNVTPLLKLFETKIPGVYKEPQSYTWILKALSNIDSDELFVDVFDSVISEIKGKHIDSKLLYEICNTLNKRNNLEFSRTSMIAIQRYFNVTIAEKPELIHSGIVHLPELADWKIGKRFPLNRHIYSLFLDACLNSGNYQTGIRSFEEIAKKNPLMIDLAMCHNLLSIVIQKEPKNCAFKCLDIFKMMEEKLNIKISKHTIVLINKSFVRQSLKAKSYYNAEIIENMMNAYLDFLKTNDGVYSNLYKSRILGKKSWKFLFVVIKNLNKTGEIPTKILESVVHEYMKSINSGIFDVINLKEGQTKDLISEDVYISLEGIRLIKLYLELFSIDNFNDSKLADMSEESKRDFLFRRLLLRYKNKLVERVDYLEKGEFDKIKGEMEYIIKKWSTMILKNEIPNTIINEK
ncbi:hypothetical protein TPHA_0J01020 [Tetrapisispora phaffii CBS 4417]|uniref:Mitochondrial group I intron splicing factor CCM1 n=1 Tax=Tetrapisispora phaffii (strain ATCC 24235 / CBS 4417 / NBRC 1672 / NRRL Y-8282 / UCD 70-5) TaxID=1071381 RepID=G8BYI2_TETPH|nr:hypothetical protein TPHA_0J01020 [Tetrapisispora phaffii CBS 4417]CCE64924.1 hypothetical protein TPHA_0J01020 [Tetrapisispora phaffii CBS 4417]